MGGSTKWLQEHTVYVTGRFTTNAAEKETKWFVGDAAVPIARRGQPIDPRSRWWNEVKELGWGDQMKKQVFTKQVQTRAEQFPHSAHNSANASRPLPANNSVNGGSNANVNANDSANVNVGANLEDEEEEVVEIEIESNLAQVNNSVSLAYLHCVYNQSDTKAGAPRSKGHVIVQTVSGWTLSEEKDKGDFVVLSDGGKSLCLSITANSKLFDMDTPSRLLTESELFGDIYATTPAGIHHPAVTSMQLRIAEAMKGEGGHGIPSHNMKIPLMSSFRSISAVSGLHKLVGSSSGDDEYIPVLEKGPQVRATPILLIFTLVN